MVVVALVDTAETAVRVRDMEQQALPLAALLAGTGKPMGTCSTGLVSRSP